MTEEEWMACADPTPMVNYLRNKVSDRKLRLFAVACCKRMLHLMTDDAACNAVQIAERFADGLATKNELRFVRKRALRGQSSIPAEHCAGAAGASTSFKSAFGAAYNGHLNAIEAIARGSNPSVRSQASFATYLNARQQNALALCGLLRHIFGNPFRPYPAPESWSTTVTLLAQSMYEGQDCWFALHDALVDAGHLELAEHFKEGESHPKGCWVLDVLLGKT